MLFLEFLADLQEDLLQSSYADAVFRVFQVILLLVDLREQIREAFEVLHGKLHREVGGYIRNDLCPRHMLLYQINDLVAVSRIGVFHQAYVVPNSELILQIDASPAAVHLPVSHYPDSVPQVVGFVHEMSGQQDYSVILVSFKQFPNVSPGSGIHPTRRLIQNDHFRSACKSQGNRESPLLSA